MFSAFWAVEILACALASVWVFCAWVRLCWAWAVLTLAEASKTQPVNRVLPLTFTEETGFREWQFHDEDSS